MIDTTESFFSGLAQRSYGPLLHSVAGTIGTQALRVS